MTQKVTVLVHEHFGILYKQIFLCMPVRHNHRIIGKVVCIRKNGDEGEITVSVEDEFGPSPSDGYIVGVDRKQKTLIIVTGLEHSYPLYKPSLFRFLIRTFGIPVAIGLILGSIIGYFLTW